MTSEVQLFQHPEFGEFQTLEIDGKIYFPATRSAEILGYSNPQKAIRDHCQEDGCTNRSVIDRLGRNQEVKFISEGNLYRLIARSKLPAAEKFEKWVFDEVLPTIRSHGFFATEDFIEHALSNPDYAIRLFTELKNERQRRQDAESIIEIQSAQIAELKDRTTYYDVILACKKPVAVSYIAQDYGMNATRFNRMLKEFGIQHRVGTSWVLNTKYVDCGYTKSCFVNDKHPEYGMLTKWTQKGREFLYYFLKSQGILPKIETL